MFDKGDEMEKIAVNQIVILAGSKICVVDHNTSEEMVIELHEDLTIRGGILRQIHNIKGEILKEKHAKKEN